MERKPAFQILICLIITFSIVYSLGCARSEKRDTRAEEYYDTSNAYYAKPGERATPTSRIAAMGQPKKRVVVLDFWNDTPATYGGLGEFAADELRRGLFLTERVIMPTDLRSHFETLDFVTGNKKIKVAQLIREGRRMSVSVIVIGKIAKLALRQRGDEVGLFRQMQSLAGVDVEIKMFDVNGGREIMAIGRSGQSSNNAMVALEDADMNSPAFRTELSKLALRDAVSQLVPIIVKNVEKMEWEGKIAKIIGNKVYLNSGRTSGLVLGDILKVLTRGDEVYDPASGAFLGKTNGQLKGTLEVVDFMGNDSAVGVVHTGGHFKSGDVVRLY